MKINPIDVQLCEDSYSDTSEYYLDIDGEVFELSKERYELLKLKYSDPDDIYWVYSEHQEPVKMAAKDLWASCSRTKDEQEAWTEHKKLRAGWFEQQIVHTQRALDNLRANLEELKNG